MVWNGCGRWKNANAGLQYVDLLSQLHLEPQTTAVHLPRFVLEEADKYRFLLPGGCMREDALTVTDSRTGLTKEYALEDDMQVR